MLNRSSALNSFSQCLSNRRCHLLEEVISYSPLHLLIAHLHIIPKSSWHRPALPQKFGLPFEMIFENYLWDLSSFSFFSGRRFGLYIFMQIFEWVTRGGECINAVRSSAHHFPVFLQFFSHFLITMVSLFYHETKKSHTTSLHPLIAKILHDCDGEVGDWCSI